MSETWDRHVAIVIATFEKNGGETFTVSTACAVATTPTNGTRLVTTRHGLFVDGAVRTQIEIAFEYCRDDVHTAALVWDSSDLDLAVLECKARELPARIVPAPHALESHYTGVGYPQTGTRDDARRAPVALSGDLYPHDAARCLLQVGVEYEPSKAEGWQGASGAPVFVDGNLVGLIAEVPTDFAGRRLDVIDLERAVAHHAELAAFLAPSRAHAYEERMRQIRSEMTSTTDRMQLERLRDEATDIATGIAYEEWVTPAMLTSAKDLVRSIEKTLGSPGVGPVGTPTWSNERRRRTWRIARIAIPAGVLVIAAIAFGVYKASGPEGLTTGIATTARDAGVVDAKPVEEGCNAVQVIYKGEDWIGQMQSFQHELDATLDKGGLRRAPWSDADLSIEVSHFTSRVSELACLEIIMYVSGIRDREQRIRLSHYECAPAAADAGADVSELARAAWTDKARASFLSRIAARLDDLRAERAYGVRFVTDPSNAIVRVDSKFDGPYLIEFENWGAARTGRVFGCLPLKRFTGNVALTGYLQRSFDVKPASPAAVVTLPLTKM